MSYKCSSSYPYLSCRWVNLATCYHSWKVWILYTQRRQLTVLQRQKRTFHSLLVPFNRRLSDSLRGPDLSDLFFVLMCNTLTASLSGFLSLEERREWDQDRHTSPSRPQSPVMSLTSTSITGSFIFQKKGVFLHRSREEPTPHPPEEIPCSHVPNKIYLVFPQVFFSILVFPVP